MLRVWQDLQFATGCRMRQSVTRYVYEPSLDGGRWVSDARSQQAHLQEELKSLQQQLADSALEMQMAERYV